MWLLPAPISVTNPTVGGANMCTASAGVRSWAIRIVGPSDGALTSLLASQMTEQMLLHVVDIPRAFLKI